jgi:hypothetical protein
MGCTVLQQSVHGLDCLAQAGSQAIFAAAHAERLAVHQQYGICPS